MKIWVAGSGGVLGSHVAKAVEAKGHDLVATTHYDCPIDSLGTVVKAAQATSPDAIINCAGKLPNSHPVDMVMANATGPHILATLAKRGIRIIHMSTDCVFSGHRCEWHHSADLPNPPDLYGRTKLAGEVDEPNVLNVRGSFVDKRAGFLWWLRHAWGEVEAWDNTEWNGTTAEIMAGKLVELAEGKRMGIVHVASPKVTSKGWMVEMFVRELKLPLTVVHKAFPPIYHALMPDIELPDVEEVLVAYARELGRCRR